MLILKGASPRIAQMKSVRCALCRIDVDRTRNRYDIYIDGPGGVSMDILKIYNNQFLNVRVLDRKGVVASFQICTDEFESANIVGNA